MGITEKDKEHKSILEKEKADKEKALKEWQETLSLFYFLSTWDISRETRQ